MTFSSFENLAVWQRACQVSVSVYDALRNCREFGLRDQMTRAAVSIPSNIAEGAERDSRIEFVRFLNIAKGSCAELRTQMLIAKQIGVLNPLQCDAFTDELRELSAMLHGLVKSLKTEN